MLGRLASHVALLVVDFGALLALGAVVALLRIRRLQRRLCEPEA